MKILETVKNLCDQFNPHMQIKNCPQTELITQILVLCFLKSSLLTKASIVKSNFRDQNSCL